MLSDLFNINKPIWFYLLIGILVVWLIYSKGNTQPNFLQLGGKLAREGQPCDSTNPCISGLECYRNVCVLPRSNDFYADLES